MGFKYHYNSLLDYSLGLTKDPSLSYGNIGPHFIIKIRFSDYCMGKGPISLYI